jgi:general secretion pathway protein J
MSARSHAEAGFTLVEAMVSLFVVALIASAAVAMLAQSAQTQARMDRAGEELRQVQSAQALLAADLAQLVRGGAAFSGMGEGDPEERGMQFQRLAGDIDPDAVSATSSVLVRYALDETAGLVRTVQTRGGIQTRRLLTEAEDIRFAFHDGVRWREDWPPSAMGAPRAAAVLVRLPRYGDVRVSALAGF